MALFANTSVTFVGVISSQQLSCSVVKAPDFIVYESSLQKKVLSVLLSSARKLLKSFNLLQFVQNGGMLRDVKKLMLKQSLGK